MLKSLCFLACAVGAIAACSSPSADPPSGPAAAAAPVLAPSAAAYISSARPGSSRAKTCSINGMIWKGYNTQINPTMIVSNDGFCGTNVHLNAYTGVLMHVASQPSHGRITTAGDDTSSAGFRYHPDNSYVGPDAFVMVTGSARHEVVASFSVNVTN